MADPNCKTCDGTGECPDCNGTGLDEYEEECLACDGTGKCDCDRPLEEVSNGTKH